MKGELPEGNGDTPSLTLELLDSATVAEGPPFLLKIFEAAQLNMQMTSRNVVSIVPDLEGRWVAKSSVSLNLDMKLPSWIPIPVAVLERRGSQVLSTTQNCYFSSI